MQTYTVEITSPTDPNKKALIEINATTPELALARIRRASMRVIPDEACTICNGFHEDPNEHCIPIYPAK